MPSIPQSLLWISLVVLWLFVLVPMLISKRDAVRRTSDVALATRVLNSARGRPAAQARADRRRAIAATRTGSPRKTNDDDDLDDVDDDETEERSPSRVVTVVGGGVGRGGRARLSRRRWSDPTPDVAKRCR